MDNKSVLYQLMDTRMGEALHKITKEDTSFMQTKEKADEYAAKLASLNLPEETMRLIDQYVNERSANWVQHRRTCLYARLFRLQRTASWLLPYSRNER